MTRKPATAGESGRETPGVLLAVPRLQQPDDLTCGPTCLAQVYSFYDRQRPLPAIIRATPQQADGGTLAVYLGISALRDGYRARIYSYNLRVFDPTWYELETEGLVRKLQRRREIVQSEKLRWAINGYLEFLEQGGELRFAELSESLLARILAHGHPIITGLNATYLWRTPREYQGEDDDVRGDPVGHFVVVSGYDPIAGEFVVRDPSPHVPFSRSGRYSVRADRLISAILLGDATYDAVLLELSPRTTAETST